MTRVRTVVGVVLAGLVVAAASSARAQEKVEGLAGRWSGSVKADVGEMTIEVRIAVEAGKVAGEIETMHGAFRITSAERQKDGRWKIAFIMEESATGAMIGVVKGDTLAGDWDFRPNAEGTFSLTRVRTPDERH